MNVKSGIVAQNVKQMSVKAAMNQYLDNGLFRKRFDDLLGRRTPQFVASLVSLVNSDDKLLAVFQNDPMSIIQSALKAAAFDLPIDPGLGYVYIIPFNSKKLGRVTANFIVGYKGRIQLALRTGLYVRLNAIEVHEGELVSYDLLTEDIEFNWIKDPAVRKEAPVVGYVAFYRLKSGMEKTIYMTKAEMEAHEMANRKGKYMSPIWNDHFDDMGKKTVLSLLLSKWGPMSINYLDASPQDQRVMEAIAKGQLDDDDAVRDESITIDNTAPASERPEDEEIPMDWGNGESKEAGK